MFKNSKVKSSTVETNPCRKIIFGNQKGAGRRRFVKNLHNLVILFLLFSMKNIYGLDFLYDAGLAKKTLVKILLCKNA